MASPFKIFRKHQGVLLAVFGIAIMIAFVVLPAVVQMQQTRGGPGHGNSEVVMTWTGGDVTASELQNTASNNSLALQFLLRLREVAQERDPNTNLSRGTEVMNQLASTQPRAVVQSMLLARKAQDAGIVVSDDAIYRYLMEVTDNGLDRSEIDGVHQQWVAQRRSEKGRSLSMTSIFNALRTQLMAYEVGKLASVGLATTSPADAWNQYNRINRRVSAEFVAFPVEDFVSQVSGEPTSAEIKELYDKYKYQDPNPDSAEPGFHRPKKVDFQYFVADLDNFVKEEKDKVTQKQLEEFYQQNKDTLFRVDDFGEVDELDQNDPRKAAPRPPQPLNEDATDAAAEKDSESQPKKETDPASEEGNAEEDSGEEAGGCGQDPEAESADDSDSNADDGQATSEEKAPPATDPATKDPAKTDPPETGAAEKDPPADGEEKVDDDLTLKETPKKTEYTPLADVEDEIRSRIAGNFALNRLNEKIDKATQALRQYESKYWDFDASLGPDPGAFDARAVAKRLSIQSGKTGLVSARTLYDLFEADKLALGGSMTEGNQPQYFLTKGYSDGLLKYQPIETELNGRQKVFVSWKVAEEEAGVPELDEVRDEVVKAWRYEKARELAKQAAEKVAQAIDGSRSLKGQVPSDKNVLAPPAFSYVDPFSMMMVQLGQRRMPEWGEIEDVEDKSTDAIKRAVVKMPEGDVEVLPNANKSTYYVVRVAGDSSDEDASRKDFIQSIVDNPIGEGPPLQGLMVSDRFMRGTNPFVQWYEQLEKDYDVKFVDEEYFRGQEREG